MALYHLDAPAAAPSQPFLSDASEAVVSTQQPWPPEPQLADGGPEDAGEAVAPEDAAAGEDGVEARARSPLEPPLADGEPEDEDEVPLEDAAAVEDGGRRLGGASRWSWPLGTRGTPPVAVKLLLV